MQNIVAKKQARQEDVDSDYLFDNFKQFPGLSFFSDPLKRK
jgi:hypothetical protein